MASATAPATDPDICPFDYPPDFWPSHLEHDDAIDEFADLEALQFLSTEGIDKQGRRILRIVGKFLPAPVIESTRLKEYVVQKMAREIPEERFCVVYFHTSVSWSENCPGVFTLRSIYKALPQEFRHRLEAVYFVHPGLLSRTLLFTVGRFFVSDRLYDKVEYVDRLEFLWDYVRKGQLEVPDFVFEHDELLEDRPLMDYWVESSPWSGPDCRQHVRWTP